MSVTRRRRSQSNRARRMPSGGGLLSPRRGKRWNAYFITGVSILVALTMALPFCARPFTG